MTVTNVTPPVISGTTVQGNTLHSTPGTWTSDDPLAPLAYQWERCDGAGANCVDISGATSSGYILAAADVGHTIRVRVTATEIPPGPEPPPPSGGDPIPANGIITTGGQYTDAFTGRVIIQTAQPVILSYCTLTQAGAGVNNSIIYMDTVGGDLTVSHCTINGLGSLTTDPRWLQVKRCANLLVENNSITYTRGINIGGDEGWGVASGATIRITKNYHHNIVGSGKNPVSNFVQFQVVTQAASIEVDWNQVINQQNLSNPEDIISCYYSGCASANAFHIHDNYFQHQSKPYNVGPSTQNSITMEGDNRIRNLLVEDNQVVDAMGISIFNDGPTAPHDCSLLNNRVISDRYLPDGTIKGFGYGSPLGLKSGCVDCHAHGNEIGYVNYDGSRSSLASNLAGAAEGATAEAANNTYVPDPINAALEAAEWTAWEAKLAANGITVGA